MNLKKYCGFNQISEALRAYNGLHDASMVQLIFVKERKLSEDGSDLIYDYNCDDDKNFASCIIRCKFLLNYNPNPNLNLIFTDVRDFQFCQQNVFDFSDIYEVFVQEIYDGRCELIFYVTAKKFMALRVVCLTVEIFEE